MCGINCYIGHCNNSFKKCYNGLRMLSNRGYDSCGCAGIINNELKVKKYANETNTYSIDLLEKNESDYNNCNVLIMHNRWATHGSKTSVNAHPHVDFKNRIAIVHNGIIENYAEIKEMLETDYDVKFLSQTDTEVIVNLISVLFDKINDLQEAIAEATTILQGTWAFAIIFIQEPTKLYISKHGSPLLIGFGDNFIITSSEQSGFCENVNNYICLRDSDVVVLEYDNIANKVHFEKKYSYDIKNVIKINHANTPYPYKHWTLKEIKEQHETSARAINYGGRIENNCYIKLGGPQDNVDVLKQIDNIVILGCGTSFHAGLIGVSFFKELGNFMSVQAYDAGEFTYRDIPKFGKTLFILLSQSGETKDVHRCIEIAKQYNIFTLGVINVVDSMIARDVNCGCYLNAGREVAVASTKTFNSQNIVLSLLALWFSQIHNINESKRIEYITELRNMPHSIKELLDYIEPECKQVAEFMKNVNSCFVLGKGIMEHYSKEGALKIKEISYIHAEGYSAVALKHGPFSLLEKNVPTIILHTYFTNDDDVIRSESAIEEIATRESPIILITDKINEKLKQKCKFIIKVPENHKFSGILFSIVMQLIAYHLAIKRDIDPDRPRNLAKCVTVF